MIQSLFKLAFSLAGAVVLQSGNCISLDLIDDVIDRGPGGVASDSIRVRFVNQTSWALGVQFHVSAVQGQPDSVLFISANQITQGIGFAGQGFIPPGDVDEVLLGVAQARMIGTLGGDFVDPDTGESAGTGQRRVLILDQQYFGGETITFVFAEVFGRYETRLRIE